VIEVLVILACVTGKGCAETSTSYYNTSPALRDLVKDNEVKVRQVLGPYVVEYVVPVMGLGVGSSSYIKINKNFSTKLENNVVYLKYIREW